MYCLKATPTTPNQTMIDSMLCIPKIKLSTWHHWRRHSNHSQSLQSGYRRWYRTLLLRLVPYPLDRLAYGYLVPRNRFYHQPLLLSSLEERQGGKEVTHLSTAETIAAVPAPKTSSNEPFFSASTKSPIVIFLSDTLRLEGRPGIDLPSMCPRHRFNTLLVSFVR
jgi:hypothetical protein